MKADTLGVQQLNDYVMKKLEFYNAWMGSVCSARVGQLSFFWKVYC